MEDNVVLLVVKVLNYNNSYLFFCSRNAQVTTTIILSLSDSSINYLINTWIRQRFKGYRLKSAISSLRALEVALQITRIVSLTYLFQGLRLHASLVV